MFGEKELQAVNLKIGEEIRKVGFMLNIIRFVGLVELFAIFLAITNIITFVLYAADKRKAVKNAWRISEKVLLIFTLFGGIGALWGMFVLRHKTKKIRFRVFVTVGIIIAVILSIHIGHHLTFDQRINFVELEFVSENWPSELNGYRIAFMSDFHSIPHESMAEVVTELNQRELDLLLLGGDFSLRDNHYQGTLREIGRTITGDGIFGVEGNHDDHERLFVAMERYGITLLENSGLSPRPGFYLAGLEDLWNRNPDIAGAIDQAEADDFVLLFTHNPDVAMGQSTTRVDLILSGHSHGGQITFFGYPVYLLRGSITDYGIRFSHGFAESRDGTPVYTTSGVGEYYLWPRIFSRPEVVIFTMYNQVLEGHSAD